MVIEQFVDEVESDLVELPENLVQANDRLTAGCLLDEEANFVATGRGGIPASPAERLNQELIWTDPRSPTALEPSTMDADPGAGALAEAQGWQRNDQGQVTGPDRPWVPRVLP